MRRIIGRIGGRIAVVVGVLSVLALGAALAGPGAESVQAQAAGRVSIVDFAFNPASATVAVGSQVVWTNTGQAPHTSTSQAGGWDSGRLSPGQTFTLTASRAGSFAYICTVHPSMTGTLVVQAGAGAAAAPATAAAMPRTGVGLVADNQGGLQALGIAVVVVLALMGMAYRRRHA
jgi:plastocyanin